MLFINIYFLSYLVGSDGGEVRLPPMTEPGPSGEKRKKRIKKGSAVASDGGDYLPQGGLVVHERSPYPARGNEVQYKEASEGEEIVVEVENTEEVDQEEMARRGEESDIAALLRYMKETEDARRMEMVETFRHMRGEDAARQREEDERRQRYRL